MPPASPAVFAPGQRHTPDGYVRLQPGAFGAIVLEHLCTVQDLSLLDDAPPGERRATLAGITEWHGHEGGRPVTLGWDWLRLHDGAVVADTTVAPRTNLMPLDARGYDTVGAAQAEALWRLIGHLDWQPTVEHSASGFN